MHFATVTTKHISSYYVKLLSVDRGSVEGSLCCPGCVKNMEAAVTQLWSCCVPAVKVDASIPHRRHIVECPCAR